jgi:Protein of unknown function (DUF4435)
MTILAFNASKTPGVILAEIAMMSTTFKGIHFLVEGDDDGRFWKRRVAPGKVSIVDCEGKPKLLEATRLCLAAGIASIVGVYDSDFDRLFDVFHFPKTLSQTDHNDLETTMLASEALSSLLHEFGDAQKISGFEDVYGTPIADHIEKISSQFGQLRFLSRKMNHGVNFDNLSPYRFVSRETWTLDRSLLLEEYAVSVGISVERLNELIQTHCLRHEPWSMSQGHDSVRILAQGLRSCIGHKQLTERDVSKVLRIAYSLEQLKASKMYHSLKVIEQTLPSLIFD